MNKQEIRKLLVAAGEQSRAIITRSLTRVGFSPLHIDFLKSFIFFPGCFARSFAARAHALKLHFSELIRGRLVASLYYTVLLNHSG